MPALTPWFPPSVKPVHKGVYITSFNSHSTGYSYWNGRRWGFELATKEEAISHRAFRVSVQAKSWRGLAAKP